MKQFLAVLLAMEFFHPISRSFLYAFYALTRDMSPEQHLRCQKMILYGYASGIAYVVPFLVVIGSYLLIPSRWRAILMASSEDSASPELSS